MMNPFPKSYNPEPNVFSGQTFLWFRDRAKIIGSFKEKIIVLEKIDNEWVWQTYPERDDFEFINHYFNLNFEKEKAIKSFREDSHILKSYEKYPDVHVLNQPFEETIISFILASNKNIKAIRRSIQIMKEQRGDYIEMDGSKYYFYPDIDYLKKVSFEKLSKAGTGYRTKYLKDLSIKFSDLNTNDNKENVLESLKTVNGIGDKVADCVMTFSLEFRDITPIDRWTDRFLEQLYGVNDIKKYEDKRNWLSNKFGEHTGYIGQLLFEYIRDYDPSRY